MSSNLTKQELVSLISERCGFNKLQSNELLNQVFEAISEELIKGKKFTMPGFGTFGVRARQPRNGVHPQTGQPIVISGKLVATFKAGKQLSEALNSAESLSNWVRR